MYNITGIIWVDIMIYIIAISLLYYLVYLGYWHITFIKVASEVRYSEGKVVDMNYTDSYTTYTSSGSSTIAQYHPAIHDVYVDLETVGHKKLDNIKLYQTVRMGDTIKATYKEITRVRRDNKRDRQFMYYKLIEITAPTGQKIKL
jgi:hypothetical protein